MENSYDIILKNENYTIGKVIESILHYNFYLKKKILTFVGYCKYHPHDSASTLRIAFKKEITDEVIQALINRACDLALETFTFIQGKF